LKKPRKLGLLCALLLSPIVSACSTHTVVADRGCDWTRPITYDRKDTVATVNQIRQHNAARDAICERKHPRQPLT
jgi:hypothetical protein